MTLDVQSYDFYTDATSIDLVINSTNGPVTIPMSNRTARDIGAMLMAYGRHQ